VIGTATHKLKEVATKGNFGALSKSEKEVAASNLWDEEIAKGHDRMVELALGKPVDPKGWRRYQLNRISAIKYLVDSSNKLNLETTKTEAHIGAEVKLDAKSGRLIGTADLIHETPDGVHIIDYKTSDIYGSPDSQSGERLLRPQYRRQMQLYAYMHHERSGEWPIKLTVSKSDGTASESIDPDPQEANSLAAEAIDLLDEFNLGVESGSLGASPSVDSCSLCPFKAACPSFFKAVQADWKLGSRTTVRGRISTFDSTRNLVTLDAVTGNVVQDQVHVLHVPNDFFAFRRSGDTVSFSNLEGSPDKALEFVWWSRSWKWL